MRCRVHISCKGMLFFCLGLLLHTGEARVHTEVQPGPLYRVSGTRLSISCNVSGFADAGSPKEFQFSVTKPAHPTFAHNIISTGDDAFAYAKYGDRVRSGDVTLRHVGPNSVLFEIGRLREDDEGDYDCTVVNAESTYDGIYSVKTTVKVIANSLSVSSSGSPSPTYNEGDALALTCQASSDTRQHTHLSFAWYLRREGAAEAQPVMSLDRDFTLSPGAGFEGRYHAGLLRLDKVGEATYTLGVARLEPSDRGWFHCMAKEWIQDPDRSWYAITQMGAEQMRINVTARDVEVKISTPQVTLQEGQELPLSCHVDTRGAFVSVAWLRGSDELARMGPTGVLSLGPDYGGRATEGKLRASRTGERDFRLVLWPVRSGDRGEYSCRAWPEDRGQDGAFTKGDAQTSSPVLVTVSATEASVTALLVSRFSQVTVGQSVELICRVKGPRVPMTLTWSLQRGAAAAATPTNILTWHANGGISWPGEQSAYRVKVADEADGVTHRLLIDRASQAEAGTYRCTPSVFLENVRKELPPSNQVALRVLDTADDLRLDGKEERRLAATEGQEVTLRCTILSGPLATSLFHKVAWLYTPRGPASVPNVTLVELDHTGALTYPEGAPALRGLQGRLRLSRPARDTFRLDIQGAREDDGGTYRCLVEQYRLDREGRWQRRAWDVGGPVAVAVNVLEKKLSVETADAALNVSSSRDFTVPCRVDGTPDGESQFQVTWFRQREAESRPHPIFVAYRNGTLQDLLGDGDRLRFGHALPGRFSLAALKPGPGDAGLYFCEVEEWLPSLSRGWRKAAAAKSGHTTVHVYAAGEAVSQCKSGTWMGILLPVVVLLLVVIILMALKMCRTKAPENKSPLWAEAHPLSGQPSAEI